MDFDCKFKKSLLITLLYACYVAGLLARPNPAQLTLCVP